ncbi:AhpA/YtjB family protein [Gallaecimonas sp. GXIMD4217]|uniref:AhpA/YtjB family protein n=1 Tax=Gallaecimonas sp. GXIMD4217 TaxID=3131927 RepID=UPI00311B3BC4
MTEKETSHFPQRRRRWLKLLSALLALSLVALVMVLWRQIGHAGLTLERQQISVMARALTSQAAYAAGQLMSEENSAALAGLAEQLAQAPQILDAAIYDGNGAALAKAGAKRPVLALLTEEAGLIPYVSEINHDGQVVGYLRITLSEDEIVGDARHFRQHALERLRLMLLLAGLAGLLLAQLLRRH